MEEPGTKEGERETVGVQESEALKLSEDLECDKCERELRYNVKAGVWVCPRGCRQRRRPGKRSRQFW